MSKNEVWKPIEDWLAEYFGIDLEEAERERRDTLAQLWEINETKRL